MQKCRKCGFVAKDEETKCSACGALLVKTAPKKEVGTEVITPNNNTSSSSKAIEKLMNYFDYMDDQTLFNFGVNTYKGIGTKKDVEASKKAFNVLALRGNNEGIFYLAQILLNENPPDYENAINWLKISANLGHMPSKILLTRLADEIGSSKQSYQSQNASVQANVEAYANKTIENKSFEALVDQVLDKVVQITVPLDDGCSCGSGFIVEGGFVVTNCHVVEGNQGKIYASFVPNVDDKDYALTLISASKEYDIAILIFSGLKGKKMIEDEISGKAKYLSFRAGDINYGERCYTAGNALGLGLAVSLGIVSNPRCTANFGAWDYLVQTDISSNHGNSGGALLDMNNNVIGMLSLSPVTNVEGATDRNLGIGAAGMGMCVPAEYIMQMIKETINALKKAYKIN